VSRLRVLGVGLLGASALLGAIASPAGAKVTPPDSFFGISGDRTQIDMAAMSKAGAKTFTTLFHWRAIQKSPGDVFDWAATDEMMSDAAANGVQVVPALYGSAAFVGEDHAPPLDSAEDEAAWANFVSAAVARYGRGGEFWALNPTLPEIPIEAWQVWQEPGLSLFFRPKPSPSKYARLLEISAPAIRSVDPDATILFGGLNDPRKGTGMPLTKFLNRLYEQDGVRENSDALALHPYGSSTNAILNRIDDAQKAMREGGDRGAPIWVTEIGWASHGTRQSHKLVVGEKKQKKNLKQAFKLLKAKKRKYEIQTVLWYTWRDSAKATKVCTWCGGAGLVDSHDDAKPALGAFKKFAR
jgi:hypothetical protein